MTWREILGPERLAKGVFWTRTWFLVSGCTPVSPGCAHCWLRDMPKRSPRNYPGGICTQDGQWTGKIVTHPERLDLPLKVKKPQVWAISSDLFHEKMGDLYLYKAFDVMAACQHHLFLIITKRPQRALDFTSRLRLILPEELSHLTVPGCSLSNVPIDNPRPLPNVFFLFTAENQEQADIRLPQALQIPAAKRIVLYEPALGPLDLRNVNCPGEIQPFWSTHGAFRFNALQDDEDHYYDSENHFHGVIAGGETGPHARPAHPDWFRQVRDDCQAAGVPLFFKSWGEWKDKKCLINAQYIWPGKEPVYEPHFGKWFYRVGKKAAGRLLDGRTWEELPG